MSNDIKKSMILGVELNPEKYPRMSEWAVKNPATLEEAVKKLMKDMGYTEPEDALWDLESEKMPWGKLQ